MPLTELQEAISWITFMTTHVEPLAVKVRYEPNQRLQGNSMLKWSRLIVRTKVNPPKGFQLTAVCLQAMLFGIDSSTITLMQSTVSIKNHEDQKLYLVL